MKVRDLPKIERPREKLAKYGPEKLSNSELLAILLRTGKKGENVVEMSNKILKKFGAENLPAANFNELKNYSGLGPAKACEIVACFELGKRLLKNKQTKIYLSPKEIWEELKELRNHKKEHFIVFFLDSRNQEIKQETISIGSLTANLVHPREVFESAIKHSAAHIIFSHNHPSGDPEPSEDDLLITKKLAQSGEILGIEVLDHIIVAQKGYFSFKEKGLLG